MDKRKKVKDYLRILLYVLIIISIGWKLLDKASAESVSDFYDDIEQHCFINRSAMSQNQLDAIRNIVFDSERPLSYFFMSSYNSDPWFGDGIIVFSEFKSPAIGWIAGSSYDGIHRYNQTPGIITPLAAKQVWRTSYDNYKAYYDIENPQTNISSWRILVVWYGSGPWACLVDCRTSLGVDADNCVTFNWETRTQVPYIPTGSERGYGNSLVSYISNMDVSFSASETALALYSSDSDYVSDDRLKLSTIKGGGGIDNLLINMSEFYRETGASPASNTNFSDVTITVEYMQGDDVSSDTFVLSDVNSTITHSSYPSTLIHLVETPFTLFGDLSLYDDVKITSVSFDRYYNVITQPETVDSFNIAVEYYLKQTTIPIEPDSLPYDDDVVTDKLTVNEISVIDDRVSMKEGFYSPQGGGGTQLDIPDGFNVKYVMITGQKPLSSVIQSFLDYHYISGLVQLPESVVDYIFNITSTDDAEQFIGESVRDSHYTQIYDFVVYYWCPDNSLGEVDVMYYFYTTAGRLRQSNKLLADIYISANQIAYTNYALYDYLYNRLDDFENKSLLALNKSIGIQDEIKGIAGGINLSVLTGFENVVAAINGIHSSIPGDYTSNLSNIYNAIVGLPAGVADQLEYLFIPQNIDLEVNLNTLHDHIGILAMPYDYAKLTYQTMDSSYSRTFKFDLPPVKFDDNTIFDGANIDLDVWALFGQVEGMPQGFDFVTAVQSMIAYFVILAAVWTTYCHIFRRLESD